MHSIRKTGHWTPHSVTLLGIEIGPPDRNSHCPALGLFETVTRVTVPRNALKCPTFRSLGCGIPAPRTGMRRERWRRPTASTPHTFCCTVRLESEMVRWEWAALRSKRSGCRSDGVLTAAASSMRCRSFASCRDRGRRYDAVGAVDAIVRVRLDAGLTAVLWAGCC